ncbi:F-box/RNI-like superfamily protein [Striga asiatica]|uniref:F-box/RNI-like superfamily protein n=1 Tax=Striga asiatica TaxID=4170 RepID=A0A5A7Q9H2_STRAF|nr:F-box/RNI-like superfamily protein [Striga asiatica]
MKSIRRRQLSGRSNLRHLAQPEACTIESQCKYNLDGWTWERNQLGFRNLLHFLPIFTWILRSVSKLVAAMVEIEWGEMERWEKAGIEAQLQCRVSACWIWNSF